MREEPQYAAILRFENRMPYPAINTKTKFDSIDTRASLF